ncbi:MAG: class I SAM-dependent DNA methyltransferase [Cuniculiplasma sp.]
MKKRETIDAYDVYYEVYDAETMDFWEEFPRSMILEFQRCIKGKNILDLGSGPGRDAEILRSFGMEVTCVDASKNMAKTTEDRGFKTIVADIREINFDLWDFDGVWAYSSLIHITFEEAKKVIFNLSNGLKSNAILFLGLIGGKDSEIKNIGGSGYKRYFELYDDEKVMRLMEGTGFDLISVKRFQPKNHVYLNYLFRLRGK